MNRSNYFYDAKQVSRYVLWLLAMMAASYVTAGWVFILFIFILIGAIGRKQDELFLFIILATTCFMLTNGNIVRKGIVFVACTKMLLMVASVCLVGQIFGRRHPVTLPPLLSIVPYLLFIAVSSQQGWSPTISNLKLFLFSMIFFAYYGCSIKMIAELKGVVKFRSMILATAIVYIFGSVLLIPFPSISYMSSEEMLLNPDAVSLFRGMSNHSQALGPLVSVFGILLFADLVFSVQRPDKLYVSLLMACPVLLYMTSSRTAMASFIAGIAFAIYCAMRHRGLNITWKRKVLSFITTLMFIVSVAVAIVPSIRDRIVKFTVKYGGDENVALSSDIIWKSRKDKLDSALYYWKQSPYIGNGFQVSAEMSQLDINDFKQILTAPVEKSTWTYAILEEGGIIGMILFVVFLLVTFCGFMARKAYIAVSLFFTFILSNMGEFTIFSMSADGGIFWLLIFVGAVFDHIRNNANSAGADFRNRFNYAVTNGPYRYLR